MEFKKTVLTGVVAAPYDVIDGKVFYVEDTHRSFDTPSEKDADWLCSFLNGEGANNTPFKLFTMAKAQSPQEFLHDREGSAFCLIEGGGMVFSTISLPNAHWLMEKLSAV